MRFRRFISGILETYFRDIEFIFLGIEALLLGILNIYFWDSGILILGVENYLLG